MQLPPIDRTLIFYVLKYLVQSHKIENCIIIRVHWGMHNAGNFAKTALLASFSMHNYFIKFKIQMSNLLYDYHLVKKYNK